jgi:hypothetical protein
MLRDAGQPIVTETCCVEARADWATGLGAAAVDPNPSSVMLHIAKFTLAS